MENFFDKPKAPHVATDPVTGAVLGEANTPEAIKAMIRRNAEDTREAA